MITDNLATVQSRIGNYNPTLIAVSKQQPDDRITKALDAGIRIFGENRVQEASERWTHRKPHFPDLELHLIGPLQTNKVKDAVNLFDCIHTLDREKLANHIHKHAPTMPCFIQVNVGNEPQKAGISRNDVDDFHAFCTQDLNMHITGLMCIPPIDQDPIPHFQWLSTKAAALKLSNLSMGMSGDFDKAMQCGSTHIRVGTSIFGKRPQIV